MSKYLTDQVASECSFVATINCALFLNTINEPPSEEEYEMLIDLCFVRHDPPL